MEKFQIYLAGAIKGLLKEQAYDWRADVKNELEALDCSYKVKCHNPGDHYTYEEDSNKSDKEVKGMFMSLIDRSDIVLVNLDYSNISCGTGQELQRARDTNKPIIGFGLKDIYPWYKEDCMVVFDVLTSALEYIEKHYLLT